MRVYIAGPYTKGDVAQNVKTAIKAADTLMKMGHTPYCPHLTHFQHMMFPQPYETWLAHDFEWLKLCEAVYRLPGESNGADRECQVAAECGIPVFRYITDF